MDYLSQLNAVADLSVENMTPNDFAVYMRMLFFNNTLHWKEWFSITYERLCHLTGINSKHTIATALNSLEQNGYIQVKRLGKRQGNKYKIVPLYSFDYALKAEQKRNINGTKGEQKRNEGGTKPAPLIKREESKREKSSTTSDFLTNSSYEIQGGLTPAEEQVRSAFEDTFHPLTKLEELESLRALTGDYGAKSVLRAMRSVAERMDVAKKQRLSPKYFLPMLSDGLGDRSIKATADPQEFSAEEQEKRRRQRQSYDDMLAAIAEGRA